MELICPFETKVSCSTLSCQSHLLVRSIIHQKIRKQGKKQRTALELLLGKWDQSLLAARFLGQKSKRQQMTGNKTAPDPSNHLIAADEWKNKFYFSIIMQSLKWHKWPDLEKSYHSATTGLVWFAWVCKKLCQCIRDTPILVAFCCCENHSPNPSCRGKRLSHLTLYNPSLSEAMTGTQGRRLEAITEADTMEDAVYWLAQLAFVYHPAPPAQGCHHLHDVLWTLPHQI